MSSKRPTALVLDQSEDGLFLLFNGRVYLVEGPSTSRKAQKGQMVYVITSEKGTIADVEPSEEVENQLDPQISGDEILVKVRVTQRNTFRFPVSHSAFLSTSEVRMNTERLFWSPDIGYVNDEENHFNASRAEGFYNFTVALSFNLDLFYKEDDLDVRNCVSLGLLSKSVKEVICKCEKKIEEVAPWILERRKLDYQNNTLLTTRDETRIGVVIAVHKCMNNKKSTHRSFLWNLEFGVMPIRESKDIPLPKIGETYSFFTQNIAAQVCAVKLEPAPKAVKYRIDSSSLGKRDIRIILPVQFPAEPMEALRWEDDFYGKFCLPIADIEVRLKEGLVYSALAGKTVDVAFSYADPHRHEDQEFKELIHWELQGFAKEDENDPILSNDNGPRHSNLHKNVHNPPSPQKMVVPPSLMRINTNPGPSRGRYQPSNQALHFHQQVGHSQYRGQEQQYPQRMIPSLTNQGPYPYNPYHQGPYLERNQPCQNMVPPLINGPVNQPHCSNCQLLMGMANLLVSHFTGQGNTGCPHVPPANNNWNNPANYGRGNRKY